TGMQVDRLRAILITHMHSDHIAELPGVLLYNWGPNVGGFTEPFAIVGPGRAGALPRGARPVVTPPTPGTEDLVSNILSAYAYDINIRVHDEARGWTISSNHATSGCRADWVPGRAANSPPRWTRWRRIGTSRCVSSRRWWTIHRCSPPTGSASKPRTEWWRSRVTPGNIRTSPGWLATRTCSCTRW